MLSSDLPWVHPPTTWLIEREGYRIGYTRYYGQVWAHVEVSGKVGPHMLAKLIGDTWQAQRMIQCPIIFADHFHEQGVLHEKFLRMTGFTRIKAKPVRTRIGPMRVYCRALGELNEFFK